MDVRRLRLLGLFLCLHRLQALRLRRRERFRVHALRIDLDLRVELLRLLLRHQ